MRGFSITRHLLCFMAPGQVAGFVSKGTPSGNGRASIPPVPSGVISLLLGAGTLNCGISMARIVHIGQIGQYGVCRATLLTPILVRMVQHFY